MDLAHIVRRIAEAIPPVDAETTIQNVNRRTKEPYLLGAKTLSETQFVSETTKWWARQYPNELPGHNIDECLEVPYPGLPIEKGKRNACDLAIMADTFHNNIEWVIEIKYLSLVGNNGMNNDYAIGKALSPYLKDRSAIHDAERLRECEFDARRAVIIYGFTYDQESCDLSTQICENLERESGADVRHNGKLFSELLLKTVRSVNKEKMVYCLKPIVELISAQLNTRKWTDGPPKLEEFTGANRHPCGMKGLVAGWEIAADNR